MVKGTGKSKQPLAYFLFSPLCKHTKNKADAGVQFIQIEIILFFSFYSSYYFFF